MELFLTPASISFLTQTILFLGITIYLVLINTHTKANYWLAGFYTVMVVSSLAGFLAVSSLEWYDLAIAVENILIVIALPLLVQFAYNFPEINPSKKRQAKVVLSISLIVSIFSIISVFPYVIRFNLPALYSVLPIILKSIQILLLMWVIFLFTNLTIQQHQNNNQFTAREKFLHPHGRISKAARGFMVVLTGMLILWIASMTLNLLGQISLSFFLFSISASWALTFFIFTLINHTTRKASFLIKFYGIVILTVFSGITIAAWLAAPVSQANYLASYAIPDRQTVHFDLTNAIFTITQNEYVFDADIGRQLVFTDDKTFTPVNLLTTFPFAGKNWLNLQVARKGFVLFTADDSGETSLEIYRKSQPVIAALYLNDIELSKNSSVFAHLTDEKSVFTWFLISPLDKPDSPITTQLTLYPDGSFDISYSGIRSNFKYSPYLPNNLQQITGFFLGANDLTPDRIQFNSQLPYTSQSWTGVFQDYYIDFRSVMHQSMLMQLFSLLLVAVISSIIFPIFFQNSLWRPVKMIRTGIQQVMADDYDTFLEPRYSDEIGQIVMDFNKLKTHLLINLEANQKRIQELEEKLSKRSNELKTSIGKLEQEIEARRKLTDAFEKAILQQKKLSITDELTGVYNRSHVVSICEEEIKRAKRYNTPLSFILMDPDYFRMINETYGNVTGDEVLKSLTDFVSVKLRETDFLGRIGGEEFAIVLPLTTGEDALIAANRIRNLIGSQMMETTKGPIRISASFGVVEMPSEGIISVDIFLHRANQAVDLAKSQGRNKVVLWSPQMEKKSAT